MTPEVNPNVEVEAEISALKAKLTHLEDALRFPGSKMTAPGEFFQRQAEGQLRAWLERRAKVANGTDARELALSATAKERKGLEARLIKIERDCDSRLAQLDRSKQQIEDVRDQQVKEVRAVLRELNERVERETVAAEAKPVSVTLTSAQVTSRPTGGVISR